MFHSKATKKYAALDEAIARVKNEQPIESVVSAYPEAERAAMVKMLGLVSAVQSLPKVQVPAPSKRRLYLDPAYQKSKNGVLAFVNSFKTLATHSQLSLLCSSSAALRMQHQRACLGHAVQPQDRLRRLPACPGNNTSEQGAAAGSDCIAAIGRCPNSAVQFKL